jgi:hypothetical protein
MTKIAETKQRINDFFSVYFDDRTAKNVARHPDIAISLIRESIKGGLSSKERLKAYASALSDAVEYQGLLSLNDKKPTKG